MEKNINHVFKFIIKYQFNSFVHINEKSSLTSCSINTTLTMILKLRYYEIFPVTFRWCYDCDWTPHSRTLMPWSDWNMQAEVMPVSSSCDHTVIYFNMRLNQSVSGDPPPNLESRGSAHINLLGLQAVSLLLWCSADRGQMFGAEKQHCESYHEW